VQSLLDPPVLQEPSQVTDNALFQLRAVSYIDGIDCAAAGSIGKGERNALDLMAERIGAGGGQIKAKEFSHFYLS